MSKILVKTRGLGHADWLKFRRKGIGSSDAAQTLSESRYGSPFTLWAEKTGLVPISEEQTSYQKAGHILEPVIADWFTSASGKRVHRVNSILQHDKYEFMLANLDRKVQSEDAILECKNVGAYKIKEWRDELPREYYIQVQHAMAVTGVKTAYVAALVGGNTFLSYPDLPHLKVERNEKMIKDMIDIEYDFWHNYVLTNTPPEIDGSEFTAELIANLAPEAVNSDIVDLPDELEGDLQEREALTQQIKELTASKRLIDNKLKFLLSDHELGCVGNYFISYKNIVTKPYTVDGKSYRKLTVKGEK